MAGMYEEYLDAATLAELDALREAGVTVTWRRSHSNLGLFEVRLEEDAAAHGGWGERPEAAARDALERRAGRR